MDGYARRQSDDIDDVSRRRRVRVTVWEIGRDKQEKNNTKIEEGNSAIIKDQYCKQRGNRWRVT